MQELRFVDHRLATRATLQLWGPDIAHGPLIDELPEILCAPVARKALARAGKARVDLPPHVAITGEPLVDHETSARVSSVTVWRLPVFLGDHFFAYAMQVRNVEVARAIAAQMRAVRPE
jgi:hypothetical protein